MLTPNQVVNNPLLFADHFLKIQDKQKNLVPFRWNKAQVHFHANRTGRDLILKARQLGFSTLIQGEMFRRTVTSTRTTMTLAHDTDTTTLFRLMADRFYENCKFGDIQPARKYANASLTTYPEFDSSALIATAGNLESGRGGTYSDFHGSEVAFWKDAEKLIAGAMQGGNPDVVLESTPNGAQGYFYERAMEALRGEGVWKLHFYPWWWDVKYIADGRGLVLTAEELALANKHSLTHDQIAWRRNKQKELRDLFKQEYPEDPVTCFLTSGNSFFGDLSGSYQKTDTVYDSSHVYYAGLDFGQTNDYTAMVIIDRTVKQMVDLLHIRKMEWREQRKRIAEMYRKWNCRLMMAEANSIGSVNIEELRRDNLHVLGFETTNNSKSEIMSKLYEALHTDKLILLDDNRLRNEMTNFVSTQTSTGLWRLAAEGEGHDDIVIALALAWHSASSPSVSDLVDFV